MVEEDQVPKKSAAKNMISVVSIGGYMDITTTDELEKVIDSIVRSKQYKIVVDLGGVDYISSYGWSIFLGKIKELRENKGDLKLARMKPDVYEVYKLLEFFWFLKSYETIEDAVKDFVEEHPPLP